VTGVPDESSDERSSHRQILRSSGIIGGASIINILLSIARQKAAAMILGAAGVGLLGLFQSFIATAAAVSALGLGTVGSRQIAEAGAQDDQAKLAVARYALVSGTIVLAILGGIAIWLLREPIATHILLDAALAPTVGWLALAVSLTVCGGSLVALLTGLRRIGDVARVSVISAFLSTVAGVAALVALGEGGLLPFIIAAPAMLVATAAFYVARIPRPRAGRIGFADLSPQWRVMAALGVAIMLSGLVGTGGQLAVRSLIGFELGRSELGHFQAAVSLSQTYLGFVLGAMATDYYPRLTAAYSDPQAANRLVNEQSEVALLLAAPVLLTMLGAAPWILHLLYASEFREASAILRWQTLGDVLKVASWPLGYLLLASGNGRLFLMTEVIGAGVLVLVTWLAMPILGAAAGGMASLAVYLVYLPIVYWLARRRTGFRWAPAVTRTLLLLTAAAMAVFVVASLSEVWGLVAGVAAAVGFGVFAARRVGAAMAHRVPPWLRTRLGLG
jgi:O-antigen/teichoic acid export membrane protein